MAENMRMIAAYYEAKTAERIDRLIEAMTAKLGMRVGKSQALRACVELGLERLEAEYKVKGNAA